MWILLLACQEPFDLDRHDLAGFRIAGIEAMVPDEDGWVPSVAMITGGRLWSPDTIELHWHAVPDARSVWNLTPDAPPLATGAEPTLPVDRGPFALVARAGGEVARALIDVPTGALPEPGPLTVAQLPLSVANVTGADLLREARVELTPEPATYVAPGGFGRLQVDPGSDDAVVRWMATGGTFFELDGTTADWAAGDLVLDDDTIEEDRTTLRAGTISLLALVVEDGATRFRAGEVHVGEPGPGLWVAGRWLPTSQRVDWQAGDAVQGTLVADDLSPVGLRLSSPRVISMKEAETTGWGTSGLPCGVPGPFDPGWLLRQRCGRDAVAGQQVAIIPEGVP